MADPYQLNSTDRAALDAIYGPSNGGSVASRPAPRSALSPAQMSVLDAIAHAEVNQPWGKGGERGGYGETVSNQTFDPSNYSGSHPYQSGNFRYYHGRYGPSSASGRYQETLTTYRDNVSKYGIPGFTPVAQDQRAYLKASDLYQGSRAWQGYPGATGDLTKDVSQFGSDPRWWSNAAAPALHREWTSVPGGLEPNDKTHTWVNNAVFQFGHGVGGLPPESGPMTFAAGDSPALGTPPPTPVPTGPGPQIAGAGAPGAAPVTGAPGGLLDQGTTANPLALYALLNQFRQQDQLQPMPVPPINYPIPRARLAQLAAMQGYGGT